MVSFMVIMGKFISVCVCVWGGGGGGGRDRCSTLLKA